MVEKKSPTWSEVKARLADFDRTSLIGTYFKALLKMFEAALKISITLQSDLRDALLDRLDGVRRISHNLGYGLGDEMNIILADYKNDN